MKLEHADIFAATMADSINPVRPGPSNILLPYPKAISGSFSVTLLLITMAATTSPVRAHPIVTILLTIEPNVCPILPDRSVFPVAHIDIM